jgi:hypothetical protein
MNLGDLSPIKKGESKNESNDPKIQLQPTSL